MTVSEYVGDYKVAPDGKMSVTETVTARFPRDRHGIYRFFDTTDPYNSNIRRVPTITSVTRDGVSDPVDITWQSNDRYMVVRVGNPGVTLIPGSHTYVIAYTIPGVIEPIKDGADRAFVTTAGESSSTPPESVLYWNVVGSGWQLPMDKVTSHLTLPSPSQQVQCTAGQTSAGGAAAGPCTIVGAGTNSITFSATGVPPETGMIVRASMAPPPPAGQPGLVTAAWPIALVPVLGLNLPLTIFVLLLSLVGLVGGIVWALRTRETTPGFPIMYGPPQGLGPAQTVYMMREDVGKYALNATLFDMAQKELVSLEQRSDKSWLITSTASARHWVDADPASSAVAGALRLSRGEGFWFHAQKNASTGEDLKRARNQLNPVVRAWAQDSGNVRVDASEQWGRRAWYLAIACAAVWFVVPFWFSIGPTMYGLPFAAFAIGGSGLLHPGVGTRRTAAGRELWAKCGGFQRLLATDSSEERFDFAANQDLFLSFIPYAVAFGVADKWAAKYRMYTHSEPPDPYWYPVGVGLGAWYASDSGFSDFDSTI
ncbi:MAG: DUF2207 domain-containing protein, partial [Actinomycetes bacterium]